MAKRKIRDHCWVCGQFRTLTFEHVPPKKAFNNQRVEVCSVEDWLYRQPGVSVSGRWQKATGLVATCAGCNNNTGAWYGGEFVAWVLRAADILARLPSPAAMDQVPQRIVVTATFPAVAPLLFLKQVVYMILATNGPDFGRLNPDLRQFVLDKEMVGLPPRYHFHLGLLWGPNARQVGAAGKIDIFKGQNAVLAEVAFAPFSYVLRIGDRLDSLPPCDISGFSRYKPDERLDLELTLLVGFCHAPLACDYRSMAAILADGGGVQPDAMWLR
jgi:hypothetical protein